MTMIRGRHDPFWATLSLAELLEWRRKSTEALQNAERRLAEGDYVGHLGYVITSEWEQREDIKFFGRELKEIEAELRRKGRR